MIWALSEPRAAVLTRNEFPAAEAGQIEEVEEIFSTGDALASILLGPAQYQRAEVGDNPVRIRPKPFQ